MASDNRRNNTGQRLSTDQISAAAAAAEIIGGNEDLVAEILQRLPPKSLIRFKSVSKTWLFLISSDRFSLLHWQHQHPQFHDPKISGLFFTSRSGSGFIEFIPLIFSATINGGEENKSLALLTADMNTDKIVEDSCNGFLLICCTSRKIKYHVYNPTTKQFSTIPWTFFRVFTFPGDRVYLVFEPSKSLHYKFVLLQSKLYGGAYLCQMRIYSSETKAWSSPPNICDQHPFQVPRCVDLANGVYCNGSIHWISFSPLETSIYFDVDQQRFCPMPSPPCRIDVFKFWHFGKSWGHLHCINYHDATGLNVDVYEMESDYSKWTLKYR
ncbi:F-box protein At5g07610-like [Cornus florida]|uniref:F-box protein At5g07610-like n=1 Tax=Cornus florida TaxID=4283 RepID=UPI0028993F6B|nr:F-box protein At5g07610-like [Cornus florida]